MTVRWLGPAGGVLVRYLRPQRPHWLQAPAGRVVLLWRVRRRPMTLIQMLRWLLLFRAAPRSFGERRETLGQPKTKPKPPPEGPL